jgi:hypothetical protein
MIIRRVFSTDRMCIAGQPEASNAAGVHEVSDPTNKGARVGRSLHRTGIVFRMG